MSNTKTPIHGIICKIKALLSTCLSVFEAFEQNPEKEVRWVSWSPPSEGTVKVNVDGSSLGNPGKTGFGGLIRDYVGGWEIGFAGSIGVGSNLLAELQAIKNGLNLCWQHGWRSVVCESDSLEAVNLISKVNIRFHKYAGIIKDIHSMLENDWRVEIKHVLRKANQAADFLAKIGANDFRPWFLLTEAPSDLATNVLNCGCGRGCDRGCGHCDYGHCGRCISDCGRCDQVENVANNARDKGRSISVTATDVAPLCEASPGAGLEFSEKHLFRSWIMDS